MPHFDSDVELLRTPHLYESEMLAEALEKAEVPCYRVQESWGGVQTAQLTLPPQGEPGLNFLVIVPAVKEAEARSVLEGLPIAPNPNPDFWSFNSSRKVKSGFRVYALLVLIVLCLMFAFGLLQLLSVV